MKDATVLDALVLTGTLDQYAAEEFLPKAVLLLDGEGDAALELGEVDRVHGAFLQVLLALSKDLQSKGRKVQLRNVEDSARECFRVSGMEDYFEFADNRRE